MLTTMTRKLFLPIFLLYFALASAQNPLWNPVSETALAQSGKLQRTSFPKQYELFGLDLPQLKILLLSAPQRHTAPSNVIVAFPDGNGNMQRFRIYEASVMHPQLDAKHPDIRSYVGQGIENPDTMVRFSVTRFGLHAMVLSSGGTSYIDPYTADGNHYIAYQKDGLTTTRSFRCGVTENTSQQNRQSETLALPHDGLFRTYRLAMACTIEYAAFHIEAAGLEAAPIEEQKAAVLAAMVVTMTRVNGVYEREFSITMQLVPDNESLIFIAEDAFDNFNTDNILLDQSQETIDDIIGFDKYDIGHTVSTGGGGVAQLYSPCSGSKARGITGLGAPVGDAYDIDFVAHEMGHQFGGNHSFNNDCGGNRSGENAYEPGSGTTIMSYAGVCSPNVEMHSDAQFHVNSINEMSAFIAGGGNCAENTNISNIPPVVDAGKDYTIPKGTAFILKGSATDANGDALTYCWEQMDLTESTDTPSQNATEGPSFRSLPPNVSPERYMPNLASVLSNNLFPTWEKTANVGRTFNFACTVRDNNAEGGNAVSDAMVVTVSGEAGPFAITSPNTIVTWAAGSNRNVTWNVAGTTANGVDTPYVDIFLSTDNGLSFPTILAAKVPNDGSEIVTIPNMPGTNNRIMVRGYDNIFYDVSNTKFTIATPPTTMAIAVTGIQNSAACQGSDVVYSFTYNTYNGFTGLTSFSAVGNPEGTAVNFSPDTISANGTVQMTISNTAAINPGFYPITVTATSGPTTISANVYLDLVNGQFLGVNLESPADNAANLPVATNFSWLADSNATAYQIEIATDAAFSVMIISQTVTGTNFTATGLPQGTVLFWRVRPMNAGCAGPDSLTREFSTGITVCDTHVSGDVPLVISEEEVQTITSSLDIAESGTIDNLTVSMNITHTWVGDLTVKLISPQGTEVILFEEICWDSDDVAAVFNDNGNTVFCGSSPALNGILMPKESLSAFNGQSQEGIWTLSVFDEFGEDGGALNSWSLNICKTEPGLGTEETAFDHFSLYPNPNNGNFNIRFNSVTGNDIRIGVYDMRGRQIFGQVYANNGFFEQSLGLGNASAGVYLVTVADGDRKITKRIIVK